MSVNEPNMHCMLVYAGVMPPGVSNSPLNTKANTYKCMHHELLAHTKAYHIYHQKYNADKKGA